MDWIHCNKCFYRPGQQPKKELMLTTCGHVVCKCCERSSQIKHCKVCGKSCNITPLSSQMIEEVRIYFEEPETRLSQIIKVMEFQKTHRMRLNEYLKAVWEKYQKLKFAYQKLDGEHRRIKMENELYKRRNAVPLAPSPVFSQESPFTGMQGKENRIPNSPFFATPTRPASSSQIFRSQNTPSTPMSDGSGSPGSEASNQSFRTTASGRSNSQQRMYRPGLTPPLNRLSLLSVSSQQAGESSSRY